MYNPTKPYSQIIAEQIKRTWNTRFISVWEDGVFSRKRYCDEIDHTDGIGSKGLLHWEHGTLSYAVLDALAMNLNDLVMWRATPYKLQNHIFLPYEDLDAIRTIITCLADECVKREITVTGGECAIHGAFDISVTMSGYVTSPRNIFEKGDILIGLASSGIHSNGFTLLRELELPFREDWLIPTHIYDLPDLIFDVKGIQHITGGAFGKLKKRLKNTDAYIHTHSTLEMFKEIHSRVDSPTMYGTFNCGVGMVLGVAPDKVDKVLAAINGEIIGEIREGNGNVIIESVFDKGKVII